MSWWDGGGGGLGITDIPEHLPVFLLGIENVVGWWVTN